jgi:hypothetical protein
MTYKCKVFREFQTHRKRKALLRQLLARNLKGMVSSRPRLRGTSHLGSWFAGLSTPTGLRHGLGCAGISLGFSFGINAHLVKGSPISASVKREMRFPSTSFSFLKSCFAFGRSVRPASWCGRCSRRDSFLSFRSLIWMPSSHPGGDPFSHCRMAASSQGSCLCNRRRPVSSISPQRAWLLCRSIPTIIS